jgi:hypothetical protein
MTSRWNEQALKNLKFAILLYQNIIFLSQFENFAIIKLTSKMVLVVNGNKSNPAVLASRALGNLQTYAEGKASSRQGKLQERLG